jgi:hypothetical protein
VFRNKGQSRFGGKRSGDTKGSLIPAASSAQRMWAGNHDEIPVLLHAFDIAQKKDRIIDGEVMKKDHSMSAAVHTAMRAGIKRIHFIAPTATTFMMSTSKAGAVYSRPAAIIHGRVGCRRGDDWNGQTAQCACFGEEPESLPGPQAEMVIVDEIARMRYQQSVFDTMMLGLRLGDSPRVLIVTTPRTTPS